MPGKPMPCPSQALLARSSAGDRELEAGSPGTRMCKKSLHLFMERMKNSCCQVSVCVCIFLTSTRALIVTCG